MKYLRIKIILIINKWFLEKMEVLKRRRNINYKNSVLLTNTINLERTKKFSEIHYNKFIESKNQEVEENAMLSSN